MCGFFELILLYYQTILQYLPFVLTTRTMEMLLIDELIIKFHIITPMGDCQPNRHSGQSILTRCIRPCTQTKHLIWGKHLENLHKCSISFQSAAKLRFIIRYYLKMHARVIQWLHSVHLSRCLGH